MALTVGGTTICSSDEQYTYPPPNHSEPLAKVHNRQLLATFECLLLDHLDRMMDSDISHISWKNLIRMPGASEKDSSKEGMHIWHDNLNHG